jgi:hypothetical protein
MQLAPNWIPVEESIPDFDTVVVVKVEESHPERIGTAVAFAYRCEMHKSWHNLDGDTLDAEHARISHWSPMPVDRPVTSN